MLNTRFGVEIEMTGVTRQKAASVVAEVVGGSVSFIGGTYNAYEVRANDGRVWKIVRDASTMCQTRVGGVLRTMDASYSVEFVTPVLSYEADIETLQACVRALRKAGALANSSCGIHVHVDGVGHTARSLRNLINLIYSRNDLLYKALAVNPNRMHYCSRLDQSFVEEVDRKKPTSLEALEDIWYDGAPMWERDRHYNNTRYHFLNLHSFFHGHGTVEFRGFNSTLHAGEVRSYIVLALALNHQALVQKSCSARKPQTENEKFAMRTWLNRIGFIGDEFKACREHLTKNLSGCAAWRFGRPA